MNHRRRPVGHEVHEPRRRFAKRFVSAQSLEGAARQISADTFMAEEMDFSVVIDAARQRLGGIMEQRRPAHIGEPRRLPHHPQRVVPEILLPRHMRASISIGLGQQWSEFRRRDVEQSCFSQHIQPRVRILAEQEPSQFGQDPLAADALQRFRLAGHRSLSFPVDSEPELRREARGSQQAEWILGKSRIRITDSPHYRQGNVAFTTPGVDSFRR